MLRVDPAPPGSPHYHRDDTKSQDMRWEEWSEAGWRYGPAQLAHDHMRATLPHDPGPTRYWWATCQACGWVAMCTLRELQQEAGCNAAGCGQWSDENLNDPDYDWQVHRTMRAFPDQAYVTAAYRLGGAEAVQACGRGRLADLAEQRRRHEALNEQVKNHQVAGGSQGVIERKGADLQEAQPKEP